ncbi:MAG TPA: hypothetical protein VLA10_05455 [Ilumatobacter sp.]|nr:hypothetical protein [Ilumatobacter sp.]
MITTGSKLLIGSAAAAWIFALVYGVSQDGTLGVLGLISAAVALSLLAGVNVFVGDSNVSATDQAGFESAAAAQATARPSLWPLLVALGATTMTLGLVTNRTFFALGLIAVVAGALEWLVQGWSERASGEQAHNAEVRDLMADPLELPVAAAITAAVVVYSFSRVMLGLPTATATVVAFSVLATLVVAVGTLVSAKRGVSRATMTGFISIVLVALITGGAVAGLNGEREIEEHHTTGALAEENHCTAEETEADENASQSVAAKSNLAAELTLENGALTVDVPGFDGNFDELTIVRSNPSNIMFHNESNEPARLVFDLHPAVDDNGVPLGPERVCTALVEEGGTQLLTVVVHRPSITVEEGFRFYVPGSDAALAVVVP